MRCYYCRSKKVVKYGKRKTKYKLKQLYGCNNCKRKFVEEKDYERLKGGKKINLIIKDLHSRGLSLRDISHHLEKCHNINLHHSNVLRRTRR